MQTIYSGGREKYHNSTDAMLIGSWADHYYVWTVDGE